MVGLSRLPALDGAAEEYQETSEIHPLPYSKSASADPCFLELENLSSLPDFESIESWFKDNNDLSGKCLLGSVEVAKDNSDRTLQQEVSKGLVMTESGEIGEPSIVVKGFRMGSEPIDDSDVNFGSLIEKGIEKVSLGGSSDISLGLDHGDNADVQDGHEHCDDRSLNSTDAVNESFISRSVVVRTDDSVKSDDEGHDDSSSSSSDSSDVEENKLHSEAMKGRRRPNSEEVNVDEDNGIEEGEIMLSNVENLTAVSDNEDDDYSDGDGRSLGPIRSRTELEIRLPVPAVTVSLQPQHQTIPVGSILSIIGSQVIVEGAEKHNPLSEGSILWIDETRLPLGIVDEIFGPVKNPYYVVRFNSDDQVPCGIAQGKVISYAEEFSEHVLDNKNLYQKGYDASGENDEEISDEFEFSDDEKEAEYRRMVKVKKREAIESKTEKKGKGKRRSMNQKKNNHSQNQTSLVGQNSDSMSANVAISPACNQNFASLSHINAEIRNDGFPNHSQNSSFSGVPEYSNYTVQGNEHFQNFHLPFQQQIGIMPRMPVDFNAMNLSGNQAFLPSWPGYLDPNMLSMLQFSVGLQTHSPVLNCQSSPMSSGNDIHSNHGRGGARSHQRGRGPFSGNYNGR